MIEIQESSQRLLIDGKSPAIDHSPAPGNKNQPSKNSKNNDKKEKEKKVEKSTTAQKKT